MNSAVISLCFIAYKLLHQKAWPSWLYTDTQGETTN